MFNVVVGKCEWAEVEVKKRTTRRRGLAVKNGGKELYFSTKKNKGTKHNIADNSFVVLCWNFTETVPAKRSRRRLACPAQATSRQLAVDHVVDRSPDQRWPLNQERQSTCEHIDHSSPSSLIILQAST